MRPPWWACWMQPALARTAVPLVGLEPGPAKPLSTTRVRCAPLVSMAPGPAKPVPRQAATHAHLGCTVRLPAWSASSAQGGALQANSAAGAQRPAPSAPRVKSAGPGPQCATRVVLGRGPVLQAPVSPAPLGRPALAGACPAPHVQQTHLPQQREVRLVPPAQLDRAVWLVLQPVAGVRQAVRCPPAACASDVWPGPLRRAAGCLAHPALQTHSVGLGRWTALGARLERWLTRVAVSAPPLGLAGPLTRTETSAWSCPCLSLPRQFTAPLLPPASSLPSRSNSPLIMRRVNDGCDNCVSTSNTDQADSDGDGMGNACDNCVAVANPSQADAGVFAVAVPLAGHATSPTNTPLPVSFGLDGDSLGDSCDNCPNDGNGDQTDSDLDGFGDACGAFHRNTRACTAHISCASCAICCWLVCLCRRPSSDGLSCSNVCLLGCNPSGSVDPADCTGADVARCAAGWEPQSGDVGCQRERRLAATMGSPYMPAASSSRAHNPVALAYACPLPLQ